MSRHLTRKPHWAVQPGLRLGLSVLTGVSVSFTATVIANPVLSFLDIERILSQRISSKRDEIKKVFQILDPNHSQMVTKGELKRAITAFLMPLTKDQFQDLLAQVR